MVQNEPDCGERYVCVGRFQLLPVVREQRQQVGSLIPRIRCGCGTSIKTQQRGRLFSRARRRDPVLSFQCPVSVQTPWARFCSHCTALRSCARRTTTAGPGRLALIEEEASPQWRGLRNWARARWSAASSVTGGSRLLMSRGTGRAPSRLPIPTRRPGERIRNCCTAMTSLG